MCVGYASWPANSMERLFRRVGAGMSFPKMSTPIMSIPKMSTVPKCLFP